MNDEKPESTNEETFTFTRGLEPDAFIKCLHKERADEKSWWSKIVNCRSLFKGKDLFIGIRNNYLNVYYKGCSLVRLNYAGATLEMPERLLGTTHYKYLVHPKISDPYVTFINGETQDKADDVLDRTVSSYEEIDEIMRTSELHAGDEAKLVHEILEINREHYLDTEIAFQWTEIKEGDEQDRQDRIDLAFLDVDERNDRGTIYFCEVKRENDDRLYSTKNNPGVVDQMRRYLRNLAKHKSSIIKSYKKVCRDLESIYAGCSSIDENWLKRLRFFSAALEEKIEIHNEIILLIVREKGKKLKHRAENLVDNKMVKNIVEGEFKDGVIIGPENADRFTLERIKKELSKA